MQEDRPPMELNGRETLGTLHWCGKENCCKCCKVQLVQHVGKLAPCKLPSRYVPRSRWRWVSHPMEYKLEKSFAMKVIMKSRRGQWLWWDKSYLPWASNGLGEAKSSMEAFQKTWKMLKGVATLYIKTHTPLKGHIWSGSTRGIMTRKVISSKLKGMVKRQVENPHSRTNYRVGRLKGSVALALTIYLCHSTIWQLKPKDSYSSMPGIRNMLEGCLPVPP